MLEFYKQMNTLNSSNKWNISSLMVSKNGIYAMRIKPNSGDKVLSTYNYLNTEMNITDDIRIKYKDFLDRMYNKDVIEKSRKSCINCTDEQYDQYLHNNFTFFFNHIKSLGLDLYFAPHPTDGGNYTWTKLSVNNNN